MYRCRVAARGDDYRNWGGSIATEHSTMVTQPLRFLRALSRYRGSKLPQSIRWDLETTMFHLIDGSNGYLKVGRSRIGQWIGFEEASNAH